MAGLVRSSTYGDRVSFNPNWVTANIDNCILNGPYGDFRNLSFSATGYDDDNITADTAQGAVVLVTYPPGQRMIYTDLPDPAGSVGFWNGGPSGTSTNAQPDFSDGGNPQNIFRNWVECAAAVQPVPPPTCAYTMNIPTSSVNIGTFPSGSIYMSDDPTVARPFELEDVWGILTGRLWLPCWRYGNADIYIVLDAPAYGGKLMLSESHQWLPFPANIQQWRANTGDNIDAWLFSYQKSGILPGNYKLDVIVVPSGTAYPTIAQIVSGAAAAPYLRWGFTKTLP